MGRFALKRLMTLELNQRNLSSRAVVVLESLDMCWRSPAADLDALYGMGIADVVW
jgi:hypothetical protein